MVSQNNILFLGPQDSPLLSWLIHEGENVVQTDNRIDTAFLEKERIFFLVSYGYRHIIKADILDALPDRAINLHISYLPWNRGADPNLWSFIDNTPKGVTIHYLDEGVDTGDIIVQKKVDFDADTETLATSYQKLQGEIQALFKLNWKEIKAGTCPRYKQCGTGSLHTLKDKEPILHILTEGWDTPVSVLEQFGRKTTRRP